MIILPSLELLINKFSESI